MKIGIHASRADKSLVDYCRKIDVNNICFFLSSIPEYQEKGYVSLDALKQVKKFFDDSGINMPSAGIGHFPSEDVVSGKANAVQEIEKLTITMQNLGEIGVYSVLTYVAAHKPADEGRGTDEYWNRLIEFYTSFASIAEKAQVRIATHAYYYSDRLVRNSDDLLRIIKSAPSNYNGVTFCPGLHIPGDDVLQSIEQFKGKIFFAHARDVRGTGDDSEEVFLGEGDVNFPKVVKRLQEIEYEGIICPEHLGNPRREGEDLQVEAVKYLKSLM